MTANTITVIDSSNVVQTIYVTPPPGSVNSASSRSVVLSNDHPQINVGSYLLSGLFAGSNQIGNVSVTAIPGLSTGANVVGTFVSIFTNPSGFFVRPTDTTAYNQGDLISSNTVNTSISSPSINVARIAGGNFNIKRMSLYTNVTTGWDGSTFDITLFSSPPVYVAGDNGTYAIASGSANILYRATLSLTQYGDGAVGISSSLDKYVSLNSGNSIYWDIQYTGLASLSPVSSQIFTLTLDTIQN